MQTVIDTIMIGLFILFLVFIVRGYHRKKLGMDEEKK